jgi:hypothetical protein
MEKQFVLNSESGTNLLETTKVNGVLDSIVIESPTIMKVVIESELGYVLFNNHEVFGTNYFALRVRPIDNKGHGWNYSSAKYRLNEKLRIAIFGQANQQVKLIFRFE